MPFLFSLHKRIFFLFSALPAWVFFCSSCGTTRPYVYMQGQFDTAALSKVQPIDPVVQKGDLISIIVYSDNPEATKIYNQPLITTGSTGGGGSGGAGDATQGINGGTPTAQGYLVDENGNIEFQGLGLLHLEGLTRNQIKSLLDSRLNVLLKNPYYNIRFLNNRFTMLGEINRPGMYSIPNDHINLLEALALAGDMNYFARRDNVLVMREQDGKREWARLDLTKPDILKSPYFYLKQNDIVYIEQNKKKSVVNDQVTTRNISIATALLSAFAIVYTVLRK
ncbi:MAG: polysaccharide biosynthesis/export family protein [Bacteroidetes bacterium]|nr:polysaccharide biosynthesis/export family protein [Bacteroidota bacterium]MBS1947280.1 polysaccharide biosynthesis/export family protein [Bacteroidota bacterium]MBS1973360.1 polysaccharide biosynthesis/export family protein [Bacteroidota bacterium]